MVGGHADKLQLALELCGTHQIRHEDEAPLQNTHKQGVLVVERIIQLVTQLLHTGLDLLLGQQDLQNILIHITLCHTLYPP